MPKLSTLTHAHSHFKTLVFKLKVFGLIQKRRVRNWQKNTPRFACQPTLTGGQALGQSSTLLWNADDNALNLPLTAGKIENLRIAIKKINGLVVPAGQVFGFWAHIGKPTQRAGYVTGREIREDCLVPTVAGGLCQLSNALYDAALKSGFAIIERHRHSQVVAGSLAEQDRDATVKWNYIDLRFRASVPYQIHAHLTASHLNITFHAQAPTSLAVAQPTVKNQRADSINDCYSCGNHACAQHVATKPNAKIPAQTVYLLDEHWPEFAQHVRQNCQPDDVIFVPFAPDSRWCPPRYRWDLGDLNQNIHNHFTHALRRAVTQKIQIKRKKNAYASALILDAQLAKHYAARLPISAQHLIISQNLLPYLWQSGVLGGRTFDVIMTRAPLLYLQQSLDAAFQRPPNSPTLHDFRGNQTLVQHERDALNAARQLISPHTQIAKIYPHKTQALTWQMPQKNKAAHAKGAAVLFPASGLARKGAYEARALAQKYSLPLHIHRGATDHTDFWADTCATYTSPIDDNYWHDLACVIAPFYVEHQPRLLLKALALGIPVVASPACGLPAQLGLTLIEPDDEAAWIEQIKIHRAVS
jgi:glycosyltransferase involved in cell wall biosynthesis